MLGNWNWSQFGWNFGASPRNVKRIPPLPLFGLGVILFGVLFFAENAIWTVYHGIGLWVEIVAAVVLGIAFSLGFLSWYHGRYDIKDD